MAGTCKHGKVLKNKDGFWLVFIDGEYHFRYVWLSKSDWVEVIAES